MARTGKAVRKVGGPPPLFDHQVTSIRKMMKAPRVLDASDPGTGKTRVQIELFAMRRARGGKCALVVAPKSLMRSAWEDDFKKFAPHIKVMVCPAEKRDKLFYEEADVYVINTDATKWLAKQKPKTFERFDTLIIDELSGFKHHTSQRSRALNKVKKHFPFRYGLTGTPNANSITDLWHQMLLIDDGERLGKAFFQFRASVCSPVQVGPTPNMVQWKDKPGAEQAVGHLLADVIVRNKLEECIDIPENFTYSVPYHMSPKQRKIYKQMEQGALAMLDSGRVISTLNAAGVATKLLQIASGASYSDEGTGNTPLQIKAADALGYVPIDSGRCELVADLIEEREHCVVFFNWTHQRDQLIKEFKSRGITFTVIDGNVTAKDRKTAVDHFQAGFYRVLLAHPASAAHGLTLTRGTTTIWASPTYNLEHFLQGNRRIYRAGQKKRTETIVILAAGSIEDGVFKKLNDKNARQMDMLDLLKDLYHEQ